MNRQHGVLTCRWAEMTLFAPFPAWYASEDFPWCCRRTVPARPLETTEMCRTCPGWQPRPEATTFDDDKRR